MYKSLVFFLILVAAGAGIWFLWLSPAWFLRMRLQIG